MEIELENTMILCSHCGEIATAICERCEEPYCEDCRADYNQFTQIDYDCCTHCANTQPE